jgi:outer membrane protein OmpA-like peptidoglycan-associated protein
MNLREFTKPVTVKSLNDNLATMFGKNIDTQKFTLEQLQDTRNKLRTTLSQIETNESFDNVHTNESYQKNKMFLDVLNQAIEERNIQEAEKKPDDDGDGVPNWADKQQGPDPQPKPKGTKNMPPQLRKHAEKKSQENSSISREQKPIVEGEEDKAELVMAAKDMVDRITAWMEDTAEMQTESMLELGDAIRDEMGQEQSQTFIDSVKPALEALYQSLETTRGTLTQGVTMLTGEEMPPTPMGDEEPGMEEPGMEEPGMEPTVDDESAFSDDFAASEPAVGGAEESGRMKRESIQQEIRKQKILEHQKLSLQLGRILSSKKN